MISPDFTSLSDRTQLNSNGTKPHEPTLQIGSFTITSTGLTVKGDPVYEEWVAFGKTLRFLESSIQFALGDWLNYGEKAYGEKYSQAVENTDYSQRTLEQYAWVARSIETSNRLEVLPFTHHIQVAALRLPDGSPDVEQQRHYLDDAVQNNLTVAALRQQISKDKAARVAQIPLPVGKYRCIVIDPPWPVEKIERDVRPNQHRELDYPTMDLEAIAALPIPELAYEDGCHIYLWVTHKFLPVGLKLLEQWGFTYQCLLTWHKPTGMTPYHFQFNSEHVLFGAKGGLRLEKLGLQLCFDAPVSKHSAKPQQFYALAAQVSPEPRLEMFAREQRQHWTVWDGCSLI